MKKKISPIQFITILSIITVFIVTLYSLGFFTDLFQIRGVDRELYDFYQSYVRNLFNLCLAGVLLIVIRKGVISSETKKEFIRFSIEVLTALLVIGISLHSLLRMGELLTLYQGVDIEKVRVFYPNYEYSDAIFSIGYILFSITLIINIIFLIITGQKALRKRKGTNK